MVPMHHIHGKSPKTVRAGDAVLKGRHPHTRSADALTIPRAARRLTSLLVVPAIVRAPTFAAIRKLTCPRVVKISGCFPVHTDHAEPAVSRAEFVAWIGNVVERCTQEGRREPPITWRIEPVDLIHRPVSPAPTSESSDRVAVRAHYLALRDLSLDGLPRKTPEVDADLAELFEARSVIPLQYLMGEELPTVHAQPTGLQTDEPSGSAALGALRMARNLRPDARLIAVMVDLSTAGLADALQSVLPAAVRVEVGTSLR